MGQRSSTTSDKGGNDIDFEAEYKKDNEKDNIRWY